MGTWTCIWAVDLVIADKSFRAMRFVVCYQILRRRWGRGAPRQTIKEASSQGVGPGSWMGFLSS